MVGSRLSQEQASAVAVQLGLFDDAPVAVTEPSATHAPVAAATGMPEAPVATPLRHPRANRECRLGGVLVAYHFQRGQRRTVGLTVGPQGLSVRAPQRTALREVEDFLHRKADWVLAKLRLVQEHQRHAPADPVWGEGGTVAFLGQPLTLALDPTHAFDGAGAGVRGAQLVVGLGRDAEPHRVRDTVHAWLQREAHTRFLQRLLHFAPLVGVRHGAVRLSSAGTRWGSASSDGSIRLNWRLIHLAPELIDYVVVHELSHLHEMNHSPAFWAVVARVLPDYDERRRELKRVRLPTDRH